jgi:hypothetical protein
MGYEEALSYMFITLDDYEITPTGEKDTLVISAGRVNDQIEEKGWWVFAGYTADSVFVQFSNAGTTDHILGTYAFADLDPEYSYVEIDGAQIFFSDAQLVITQNSVDSTYHAVGSAMGKNGIEYVITLDEEYIAPSQNVITINYEASSRAISCAASVDEDLYFFFILPKETLDAMVSSDYSQDSLSLVAGSLISFLSQNDLLSNFLAKGDITVSVPEFLPILTQIMNYEVSAGDYVAFAAPISKYGDINGTIAYKEFHFDYPEAIEDAKAEEKAIKKFENGQLIIEKNGVKYNAQGAILE